jgi:diguanylate cyclase (GGDEF)-like protein/PAS domain S-box-containing protein
VNEPSISSTLFPESGSQQIAADVRPSRNSDISSLRALEVYESVPEMLCVLSPSGQFLYANEPWFDALGYDPKRLAGMPWLDLVHPAERQEVAAAVAPAFLGGTACLVVEGRARMREGSYRWLRWSFRACDGHVVAIVVDVTEKRDLFEQFRLSVEASPTGMLMIDAKGEIALVNRQVEVLFGYERSELIGSRIETLIPERYRRGHVASRNQFLGAPTARSMGQGRDLFGVRKDGTEFAIEIGLNPLVGEGSASVLASIVDISERKRQERELRARVSDLQRRREEMDLLNEMSSLLQHALVEAEAPEIVASYGQRLFQCIGASIYVVPSSGGDLSRAAFWGDAQGTEEVIAPADCWALRRSQVHASGESSSPKCGHGRRSETQSQICIPMTAHGQSLGVITLAVGVETDERARVELELLGKATADQLALALSNIHLREELRGLSIRDSLTGLYNRRYLDESGIRELVRAKRRQSSVSVLMIDVDHFKAFNDSRGHPAGDRALRDLAGVLRSRTRADDIVCRYGGEEFVILLPDCSAQEAEIRAQHLRSEVTRGAGADLTISIGVAAYPSHGDSWEVVLGLADRAVYQAKSDGRDRVVISA